MRNACVEEGASCDAREGSRRAQDPLGSLPDREENMDKSDRTERSSLLGGIEERCTGELGRVDDDNEEWACALCMVCVRMQCE